MIWDKFSRVYDLVENSFNGKVNEDFSSKVAGMINSSDEVLECACGTGIISEKIAPKCKMIVATDYSEGMLQQIRKKCAKFRNITFHRVDIMQLPYNDASFDKVVAGNVIHLLDKPQEAISELYRVCKNGGEVIIPTYVAPHRSKSVGWFLQLLRWLGFDFKRTFTYEEYKEFFRSMGYDGVDYTISNGRMPCAIAVLKKDVFSQLLAAQAYGISWMMS